MTTPGHHNWYYRIIPMLISAAIIAVFSSCTQETEEQSMVLGPGADSVMHDTVPVSYVVDSLKRHYFEAASDTQRINILNELSQQHRTAALLLSNEALEQSRRIDYKYGMSDALCRRGIVYYRYAEYDSARMCYDSSRAIAEEIKSQRLIAQAIAWKGDAYRMEGEPDTALRLLQDAKTMAENCGAKNITAFCLSSMGSMYYISGDYDKSIEHTNRALLIAAELGDKFRMGFCLSSLGKVHIMQGNYAAALSSFSRALELARELDNKTLISFCLNSIGDIYRQQDDTAQARKYFLDALEMAREIGDKGRTAYALCYLGDIAREEDKNDVAIDYYYEALSISEAIGDNSMLRTPTMELAMHIARKVISTALFTFLMFPFRDVTQPLTMNRWPTTGSRWQNRIT